MYLGTKKIDKIEGNKVLFQDGTEEEYTHKQLTYLVTKKSKEATEVRNLVLDNVMPEVKAVISGDNNMTITSEILCVLEEHNVTNAEFGNILQRILMDRLDEYNKLLKERM